MQRNRHGLKDTYDSYRTIKGERFVSWSIYPSADRVAEYRKRCIHVRNIGDTLYVREKDLEAAASVDAVSKT